MYWTEEDEGRGQEACCGYVLRQKGLPNKRVNTENKDVREQVNIRQTEGKKSVGKWLVKRREHCSWRLM